MPKERSHLLIAEAILGKIEDDSLRQLIDRKPGLFYLGAVFPDMLITPFGGGLEHPSWSDLLHECPETRSSGVIHQMLAVIREAADDRAEKLIFTFGYLAHAAADIVFHPMVLSLSGNYYHSDESERAASQAAHHHLETQLDIALQQLLGKRANDRGFAVLSGLSSHEINIVFGFFADVFSNICRSPKKEIFKKIWFNFHLFMLLDRLYHNRFFYHIARLIDFFSRGKFRKQLELFYPPNYRSDLGEDRRVELMRLKDEAICLGTQWIDAAYLAWNKGSQEIALPARVEGKNMNNG